MDIKNKGINKGLHEKTNEDNEKKTLFVMKKLKVINKVKILVASVLFCAMGYVGYTAHEKMTMSSTERFMLANVEALTSVESGSGYCTMHFPCFDTYGNPTGKYSASSYTEPNCNGSYHSHSCKNCNKV